VRAAARSFASVCIDVSAGIRGDDVDALSLAFLAFILVGIVVIVVVVRAG
jgi:hypothetical protein